MGLRPLPYILLLLQLAALHVSGGVPLLMALPGVLLDELGRPTPTALGLVYLFRGVPVARCGMPEEHVVFMIRIGRHAPKDPRVHTRNDPNRVALLAAWVARPTAFVARYAWLPAQGCLHGEKSSAERARLKSGTMVGFGLRTPNDAGLLAQIAADSNDTA